VLIGIDTARSAADHLDRSLLDALNEMLQTDENYRIKPGEPVRSSQLDLNQLRSVIKRTYFQLDQNLRQIVKDESGCVCVWF
jgi:hypothetical protein